VEAPPPCSARKETASRRLPFVIGRKKNRLFVGLRKHVVRMIKPPCPMAALLAKKNHRKKATSTTNSGGEMPAVLVSRATRPTYMVHSARVRCVLIQKSDVIKSPGAMRRG